MRAGIPILLLCILFPAQIHSQTTERINFKWLFHKGDLQDAWQPGFDDSKWEIVSLPHDASLLDHTGGETGWYRKHIELFGTLSKRKIYIEFDGVLGTYDFWVNGEQVGNHRDGLSKTIFDLTPYLHSGENVIALKYDIQGLISTGTSGEGLFRNVWIHFNNELHIMHEGAVISFPDNDPPGKRLGIKTSILNNRGEPSFCRLQLFLTDPLGKPAGERTDSVMIGPGESHCFDNVFELEDPDLWSPGHPALYNALLRISDARGVVDVHEQLFGIKQLENTAGGNAILNGESINIKAVRYDPLPGPLGMAEHDPAVERTLKLIKELGFNAVDPDPLFTSPHFNSLCDRIGLLVVSGSANAPGLNEFIDPCGFLTEKADSMQRAGRGDELHDRAGESTGKPYRIILEPDRKFIATDGFDLCFITARIVDQQGITVGDANKVIKFRVKGAAENAGVCNGDPLSKEPCQSDERSAYRGKALLVVRSNQKKGEIEIKAVAGGLSPAVLLIEAI